jgi:hypothetical protein
MKTGYLVAATFLATGASAADLLLYADDDYQGRQLAVVIDEKDLGVLNFEKRASSVVVENGTWILCSGGDYSGECLTLAPGRYASLRALGFDKAITSVRRKDPVSIGTFGNIEPSSRAASTSPAASRSAGDIVLYAANEYAGASQPLDESQTDLHADALQGKATSTVIASGTWELCQDTFYRGQCVTLGPGKYPSLEELGLTHGVGSVRRAYDPAPPKDKVPGN